MPISCARLLASPAERLMETEWQFAITFLISNWSHLDVTS
ncbi:hypothetical protein ABID25_006569 [Mesorhizobium abyssinicae]